MSTTIGVVDLPFPASRHESPGHGELASRRFAGSTLLQWVAQRLTEAESLDEVVVLLDAEHEPLRRLAPPNIAVHLSQAADPLARLADVCQSRRADAVVRVAIDSPFVDPVLVDQLVCAANESRCDYATFCDSRGKSSVESHLGLTAEWIGGAALAEAHAAARGGERNSLQCIGGRPERFRVQLIPAPHLPGGGTLRLAIDTEEDWDQANQIYEALGHDGIDWRQIAILLGLHEESDSIAAAEDAP